MTSPWAFGEFSERAFSMQRALPLTHPFFLYRHRAAMSREIARALKK